MGFNSAFKGLTLTFKTKLYLNQLHKMKEVNAYRIREP